MQKDVNFQLQVFIGGRPTITPPTEAFDPSAEDINSIGSVQCSVTPFRLCHPVSYQAQTGRSRQGGVNDDISSILIVLIFAGRCARSEPS